MKTIYSILIAVLLGNITALDTHAESVLEKEVSDDVLFKQMQNEYFFKIGKAGLMQARFLEYNEKKYGMNSIETLKPLEAIAWMSMERQDFKEAEQFYRRIIKIRKELLPGSDENTKELATAFFMLGDTNLYRGRYKRAIISYDESLRISDDHGHRGDTLNRKGIAYEGLNVYEKALEHYLEALKEYDAAKTLDPGIAKLIDKRILFVYDRLPELYHQLGDNVEVKKYQDLIKESKAQMERERKAEEDRL